MLKVSIKIVSCSLAFKPFYIIIEYKPVHLRLIDRLEPENCKNNYSILIIYIYITIIYEPLALSLSAPAFLKLFQSHLTLLEAVKINKVAIKRMIRLYCGLVLL